MRPRAHVFSLAVGALLLTACNANGLPVAPTSTPQLSVVATPTTLAFAQPTDTTRPIVVRPTATAVNTEASTPDAGATSPAAGTATPGNTAQPGATTQAANTPDPVLNSQIAQVERDLSTVRGLKPTTNVPETFLTQSQMRDNLLKGLQEDYTRQEAKDDAGELWLLRLVSDRSIDLYQLQADLLSEQVLGYYDPKKKDLFVLSTSSNLTPSARQTLAHEYTHALQDQRFDLQKLLPERSKDDDRSLAVQALVEGDSTLSGLSYARDYFTAKEKQQFLQENSSGSSTVLDKAPAYLRESLIFPYNEGADFVNQLLQIGGFSAVDKALADPPTSTEQIMHPEKYLNQPRDVPVPVALQPLTDTLGAGWTLRDYGTTGEFDLKIELQENGAADPAGGAAGWGGGSYAYYVNGDNLLMLQKTVWDNESEAKEYQTALEQTFKRDQKSGNFYVDGGRYFSLQASGKTITLISSNDQAALQRATK